MPVLAAGDVIDGRYTVEDQIAKGGMALVFRVRHIELGSVHALKVLATTGEDVRERLLQEGRVQARLRHPNIVSVTDVVDVGGLPGLVMELIEGPDLHAWRANHTPTIEESVEMFRGIVSAVTAAHEHGLVHRDLKPGNILLDRTRAGLVPMVTDFGLARATERREDSGIDTREGMPIGTPSFMAPEQIHDARNADERADIWALGGILYFLLVGHPAFQGKGVFDIMRRVNGAEYDHIERVRPDVPNNLRKVIERCLQLEPAARFQKADDLLPFLDLGNNQPEPKPVQVPRPRRWTALRVILAMSLAGLAITAAGAAVILAISVIGGVAWFDRFPEQVQTAAPITEEPAPQEPAPQAEEPTAPTVGPTGCPLGAGRIGYVDGDGLGRKHEGDNWVLPDGRRVRADFDEGAVTVCRLPAGTSISIRAAPVKVRGGGVWVAVDADGFRLP